MLMSDAGGENPIAETFLTFDDGAPAMTTGQLVTGTYAPTDLQPGDTLPPSAPPGPYGTTLEVFNGTDPNGTWSLYVLDDAGVDVGTIGGFSLMVTTDDNDFVPARGQLVFAPNVRSQSVDVQIIGDAVAEASEFFFVTLYAPINATIGVAQGIGMIINDDFSVPATGSATAISAHGATLNGTVSPGGAPTTAYFEYGLTTSYGGTTAAFTLGSGTAPMAIGNGTIAGLACNTLYHFNIKATNVAGTTNGSDGTFTTLPCALPRVRRRQGPEDRFHDYRPSTAIGICSRARNGLSQQWGVAPRSVPGDYDGVASDLAVYRPSTGYWYVLL